MIPDHGNFSDDRYDPLTDVPVVHGNCTIVFCELDIYMRTGIEKHTFKAAKLPLERYKNRESMLFAQNPEGTIPRKSNNMKIFLRKIRRNIRKRSGNRSTGNILAQIGENLALFQNVDNAKYMKIVLAKEDMGSMFAKYRKPFSNSGMTKKRTIELVGKGTDMILNKSLSDDPYTEEMFNKFSALYTN
ncbi:MAG: hypothetical protein QXY74_07240 [Candidatus Bathyarchaeia archaeon]